jgi:CheY-like chemotaxis protein
MIEILAIDDDLDFHEVLKAKLPASEYKLTLTKNETEFFSKFLSQKFDICLLDLSIDDSPLKGLEILSKLRIEHASDTPVIVLSNTNSEKVISNALELGANDFTAKPLDGRLLIAKIKLVITGEQAFGEVIKFGKFPGKQPDVTITARLKLKALTELGFLVEGDAFVAKGTKVKLSSPRIREIFGEDVIEVYSTGFATEKNGNFLTTFEIDPENRDMIAKAKFWIKTNQKPIVG